MAKRYITNEDVSVRMFPWNILEPLTFVHPIVPHLIFVPLIGLLAYFTVIGDLGWMISLALATAGILVWTAVEYVVHRFAFHVEPETMESVHEILAELPPDQPAIPAMSTTKQLWYFVAHGVHHDYPNDSRRLVMPPAVSVPLAVVFFALFYWVLGAPMVMPFFAGFVFGYLVYDTTHYAVHHWRLSGPVGRFLKKHHYRHHYQDSTSNYGVSSPLWDFVFRTFRRASKT